MDSMGYLGIVLLMILENLFPPIPSEVIMPSAGFASARGDLHLLGVILAGTLGSVLGTLPLYYLGRVFGEERVMKWADKYGQWLTISGEDIKKADEWFEQHGNKAVLFGRLVPGIRSLLSIPAGISNMPLMKFVIYSSIGSAIWCAVLAFLGAKLGENFEKVEHIMQPLGKIVLGVVVLGLVWRILQRKKQGHGQSKTTDNE